MKRRNLLRKVTSSVLVSALALGITACGSSTSSKNDTAAQKGEEVVQEAAAISADEFKDTTINIRVMNEYRNLDKVVAKYEEMVANDPILSKIHLNFSFVAGGDYKDKLTMALAAQEDYDLMFCGGWHGLSNFIQEGDFADLSGYFNNDNYPGLKAAFPEDFTKAMTTYLRQEDGTYKTGIYGINLASFYEDSRGFLYREDLRKKYNCDPITDEESLMEFVKTVAENEKDMEGVSLSNFFRLDSPWYTAKHEHVYTQDNVNIFGDQTWVYVGLSDDNGTVLNAVVAGDDSAEFELMPEGYQYDFITEYTQERTKWNDYLFESRGTTDVVEPDAAITYCALTEYESKVKTLLEKIPEAECGFYVIDEAQRNREEGAVVCDMVTNNWLVVPEWSEKTDATMYFLNWMFGSKEAHDLFELGLEGVDWTANGTDGYIPADISEDEKYFMPTYSFTLNPNYVRKSEFVMSNEEINAQYDYILDASSYKLSPLAGFVFDASNVETEVANISALSNELQLTLSMYDADTAKQKIDKWHEEAEKVGLETVRDELVKQIQEFLNAKNAN
ncbi:MAG: ABC transporter substrate-binding protein [Lachnospiraceae bacterium]|nr:ABC transporter substrate-binding protein [Lachnospiraceae bacterium]